MVHGFYYGIFAALHLRSGVRVQYFNPIRKVVKMKNVKEIEEAFTPKTKLTPAQITRMGLVNQGFKELATDVADLAPDNDNRKQALDYLLIAKQQAVQAITHGISPEAALEAERIASKEAK